ncbi:unnamed protein product [Lymnaea stagnalis]|uniref:Uncharacterized protein n=1 Tax=Lymnaea stagnalis TaxID=6523 RepID=A0AAV2I330_LYMST
MCCALEAEEETNEEARKCLLDRCEKMLTKAVRVASHIATSVPELPNCVTDLWDAFKDLKSKYAFNASAESQKKLIKLCELISDYRFLPKLDETLSLLKEKRLDKDCLEIYLKKSLEDKDLDGANLMLDLIYLHQETCNKPTFANSAVVQAIWFEQAKQALAWFLENENSVPDTIWKKIFVEEYGTRQGEDYDVLLVEDDEKLSAATSDNWSDSSSEFLSKFLTDVCGLAATRVNDVIIPGKPTLDQEIAAICSVKVVVFFIDGALVQSTAGDVCNEIDIETATAELKRLAVSSPETTAEALGVTYGGQALPSREQTTENNRFSDVETQPGPEKKVCSDRFQYLLTCAIDSMLRQTPRHILLAVQNEDGKRLIPCQASGKPVLVISEKDFCTFTTTVHNGREKQIDFLINIFKHIVRKGTQCP